MRKTVLVTSVSVAVIMTVSMVPTAFALTPLRGSVASPPENYVTEGGVLIYRGDMGVPCRSLLKVAEDPNSSLIKEQAKLCAKAGFVPEGSKASDVVPAGISASSPAKAREDGGMLPDTGGPTLLIVPVTVLLGGGLFLLARLLASR